MMKITGIREGKGDSSGSEKQQPWVVYILRCGDGSLYTGITNNRDRRFKEHQKGRASRYTRARKAVEVVYEEGCKNRSDALRRERAVKALSRKEKECLIDREWKETGKVPGL